MSAKDMHITMEICHKADVIWLPQHTKEKREEKYFIDLSKETAPDEVDTLLRVLIGNNDFELDKNAPKDALLDQLLLAMDRQDLTLPGGIHFEEDGYHIYPGRCSSLEQWWGIIADLEKYESPWLGDDRDAFFLKKDNSFYIADVKPLKHFPNKRKRDDSCNAHDILNTLHNKKIKTICFLPEEFHPLFDKLDRDFKDFLDGPLQARMEQITEKRVRSFVRAFARCFRQTKSQSHIQNGIPFII